MDIDRRITELEPELIEVRRDFHRHPELGLEEHRTGKKVAEYLENLGLTVSRMNQTGVVGLLQGDFPGPTLLLRADMDALPIQEETGLDYRSQTAGVMHACGHDAHTAMLMIAAKVLSEMKERLAGTIKFVFQPNEENVGALAMIEEGLLENPRVDACFGVHVWAPLKTGRLGIAAGPVMAGMEHFELTIKGRGGHTATPQSAVDPILAAAAVISGVQVIQTREIDILKEPAVIMFGKIEGGSASNVIPDSVALSGTMRYMFAGPADSPDNPKNRFERVIAGICAAHRAGYELSYLYGHPTLINHPEIAEIALRVAGCRMRPPPEILPVVTLAGEDFSEFASRVPGAFCFVGAGDPHKETVYPHHHPQFDIDETALRGGVELIVKSALYFFENHQNILLKKTAA
ncbi:MAG: amidohydrolase [Desulfobacterales bacterium]